MLLFRVKTKKLQLFYYLGYLQQPHFDMCKGSIGDRTIAFPVFVIGLLCCKIRKGCCRMKSRNGNMKKTKRSFNEQKVQIRIQKCPRLFRLRSSEKYKKTVCKLSFTCARRVVQGKIT